MHFTQYQKILSLVGSEFQPDSIQEIGFACGTCSIFCLYIYSIYFPVNLQYSFVVMFPNALKLPELDFCKKI